MTGDNGARRGVPGATVARLPDYLHVLTDLAARGVRSVSSSELAAAAGVSPAQLRKDLSRLGSYGVRGVGYDTEVLASGIARSLGLGSPWRVVIVGAGRLGQAFGLYPGLADRGFDVIGLFDVDPDLIGLTVGGVRILPMDELAGVVAEHSPVLGVIATPGEAAADVCRLLVDAGVVAVLNFAPSVVPEPPGVHLRHVDVANELQILAFHAQDALGVSGATGDHVEVRA